VAELGFDLRRILRFGVVGSLGFAVDAGLLTVLQRLSVDIYIARSLSFAAAISVTFMLNRTYTFKTSALTSTGQVAGYGAAQLFGAMTNFAIFWLVLTWRPAWASEPWLPLAFASAGSMWLTYALNIRLFSATGR
jgi:putative flippase GtrA